MSEPEKTEATAEMVYVVQREMSLIHEASRDTIGPDSVKAWVDIATVRVPPRTKRSTVIKQALKDAEIAAGDTPPRLRALDAESFEIHEPEAYQPPMQWRLP